MIYVYIACPCTKGVCENVAKSHDAWDQLFDLGFFPFNPLFTHYQHLRKQRPYQEWTRYDDAWVLRCDAILRLPGESSGADQEVALAEAHGIPVFHKIEDLNRWRGDEEMR